MKKRIIELVLLTSVGITMFAGCGSSSSQASTETATVSTTAESSADKQTEDETAASDKVSPTLKKLREEGIIRIAGSGTAPFGFIDKDTNEFKGIDAEISTAISKKLGIDKVEFVQTTFDNLITELQSGKCDVVSSAMYITEERQKVVSFSNVYYIEGEGILFDKSKGYTSLEDMKGTVCAIEQGSGYTKVAEQYKDEGIFSRIDAYPSIDETILALTSNKADVCMADNVALSYINSKNETLDGQLLIPYTMLYSGKIGAAFSKDDPEFIAEWNGALEELKNDGTVMDILTKYGVSEDYYVEPGNDITTNP